MPTISRWFVRSALASLLLGLGLGAASGWWGGAGLLAPTVLHLLVVGWLTQMVFGVAFWLFPKYSTDQPRAIKLAAPNARAPEAMVVSRTKRRRGMRGGFMPRF